MIRPLVCLLALFFAACSNSVSDGPAPAAVLDSAVVLHGAAQMEQEAALLRSTLDAAPASTPAAVRADLHARLGYVYRYAGLMDESIGVTIVLALLTGLLSIHLMSPGTGISITAGVAQDVSDPPGAVEVLLDLVPANIFGAFVQGNVAQIVVFALLAGVATILLPHEIREPFQRAADMIAELLRKMVDLVMLLGPLGIGALAASAVGQFGSEVFGPLSGFLAGLAVAQLVVIGFHLLLLQLVGGTAPTAFLKQTAPLYATTTATCSSLASLVVSYKLAEDRLHIPRSVYAFVLPLGAQLNKPGTCIMLAGVLMFTPQAAGVPFTAATVLPAVLLGALMSAGSGGIPGGGLVMALIYVQSFGLPLEIAALVGGIYRIIDMGNTTLNMGSDLVGATILARFE